MPRIARKNTVLHIHIHTSIKTSPPPVSLNRYRYDEEETGRVKEEEMTSSFGIHRSLTAFPDMKQEMRGGATPRGCGPGSLTTCDTRR